MSALPTPSARGDALCVPKRPVRKHQADNTHHRAREPAPATVCALRRKPPIAQIYSSLEILPGFVRRVWRSSQGTIVVDVVSSSRHNKNFGFAPGDPQKLLAKALDLAESGAATGWVGSFPLASGAAIEVGAAPGKLLIRWRVSAALAALAPPKTRILKGDELPALRQALNDVSVSDTITVKKEIESHE